MRAVVQTKTEAPTTVDAAARRQASPRVSERSDPYEREADRVADRVMRMTSHTVKRACSCDDEVSRDASAGNPVEGGFAVTRSNVAPTGTGRPLDPGTQTWAEEALGHDFSSVRIHTDRRDARNATEIGARAYTLGHHIVFGSGHYQPATAAGRHLLAHELTHVVQQNEADHGTGRASWVWRQEDDREDRPNSAPRAVEYRSVTMFFDGRDLLVRGDGVEIFSFSAQSGRPILISQEDADACGADARLDTYMNDQRFVGIRNKGPIPEGSYNLRPSGIERIDPNWIGVGSETESGRSIHPGDWGHGRVALTPRGRVRRGPCGNSRSRGGFFLHGGVMAGSSGCIDIGSGFDSVMAFLDGYRRNVVVGVRYRHPPPTVRILTGLSGAFAYSAFDLQQTPTLSLGAEFGDDQQRGVARLSHEIAAAFGGGSLFLEPRIEIPFNDREAFVRAGLTGGANLRIIHALYLKVRGGVSLPLRSDPTFSGEVGAGLQYDFGRIQLEAMYDYLKPLSAEPPVHRALLGIGFRFGRE